MEKKPMASSITITALDEHPGPLTHIEQPNKKSMLSPRPAPSQNMMKRSSYYQYEMEHQNFPLSHEMVIAEDEMEDSPRHNRVHIKKLPSMDQPHFPLPYSPGEESITRRHVEPQTSRDNPR
jgi:hypothetical protein